jgi:hypothetical protein
LSASVAAPAGHRALADEAVWLVFEFWRDIGQPTRASQLAGHAWNAGCRHPRVAEAHAASIAAPGRAPDLAAASALCATVTPARGGSTAPGWLVLATRAALVAGRPARLDSLAATTLDEDGNAVPKPRHHPITPKRTRPLRFARGGRFEADVAAAPHASVPMLKNDDGKRPATATGGGVP